MSKISIDEYERENGLFCCKLCQVYAPSVVTINHHLRGRPHQMNLDKQRSASRSIYVRGYTKHTSKQDIREFFQVFGTINTIWMPETAMYAIIEFADEIVAEKVLRSEQPHLLNGKRLTVKPRSIKPPKKAKVHHQGDSKDEEDQLQKSNVDHSGGAAGSGELLKFHPTLMSKLADTDSADKQLELISSHFKMPASSIQAHLAICKVLSDELKLHFPDAIVVPFGAAISGHGTLTSDCDICLLTEPSPQERAFASGANYQPRGLDQMLADVSELSLPPRSSPVREESFTSSSGTSSASASPITFRSEATANAASSSSFDTALLCIRQMPQCSKVVPIRHARCPIIRFMFDPPGVHCDISIDNLLGLANTKLMQAYSQFDDRFALLVPLVRLWIKYYGPPRTQLNNYAVSLMLIYCLQRIQPPILPCLQNPGSWPKNMAWFSKVGFSSVAQHPPLIVAPWNCDFVPPDSLLPSTNTQSPAELLLHFFSFYSQWNGQQVVAIHCPPNKTLSPAEAKQLATDPQKLGYKVRPFKELSSLIIQDPFELDHNLCKSLSRAHYTVLLRYMKLAATILREKNSVMALFVEREYEDAETKLFSETRKLIFSPDELTTLLQRDQTLAKVAECVGQLDLHNIAIHQSVSRLALKAVSFYLTNKLKFKCTPCSTTEQQAMEQQCGDAIGPSNSEPDLMMSKEDSSSNLQSSVSTDKELVEEREDHGSQVDANGQSERAAEVLHRKRAHSSDDDGEDDELVSDETKRARKRRDSVTPLDVLHQTQPEQLSEAYHCLAMSDTWTHRRQKQRQQRKAADEKMETSELTDALPCLPPLLSLKLSLDTSQIPHVAVSVDQLPPAPINISNFKNLFALINKELKIKCT